MPDATPETPPPPPTPETPPSRTTQLFKRAGALVTQRVRPWVAENWKPIAAGAVAGIATRMAFVSAATALCTPGLWLAPVAMFGAAIAKNIVNACIKARQHNESITTAILWQGAKSGVGDGVIAALTVSSIVPLNAVTLAVATRLTQDVLAARQHHTALDWKGTLRNGAIAGLVGGVVGFIGAEAFKMMHTHVLGIPAPENVSIDEAPEMGSKAAGLAAAIHHSLPADAVPPTDAAASTATQPMPSPTEAASETSARPVDLETSAWNDARGIVAQHRSELSQRSLKLWDNAEKSGNWNKIIFAIKEVSHEFLRKHISGGGNLIADGAMLATDHDVHTRAARQLWRDEAFDALHGKNEQPVDIPLAWKNAEHAGKLGEPFRNYITRVEGYHAA